MRRGINGRGESESARESALRRVPIRLSDSIHTESVDIRWSSSWVGGAAGEGRVCQRGLGDRCGDLARSRDRPAVVDRGLMALLLHIPTMPSGVVAGAIVSI